MTKTKTAIYKLFGGLLVVLALPGPLLIFLWPSKNIASLELLWPIIALVSIGIFLPGFYYLTLGMNVIKEGRWTQGAITAHIVVFIYALFVAAAMFTLDFNEPLARRIFALFISTFIPVVYIFGITLIVMDIILSNRKQK